jgi:hypothetical protein
MTETNYDIAISFLHEDQALAQQLTDRLSEYFKVFMYARAQDELAGTDGLERFTSVFRDQSSLVVILYREKWGKTPWTRVEETAIKERGLNKGWNSIFIVALEAKPNLPTWFPGFQIYADLNQFGIEQIIGAIRTRATELGATPREITVAERAEAARRKIDLNKKREQLFSTSEGVTAANAMVHSLFEDVLKQAPAIAEQFTEYRLQASADSNLLVIRSNTGDAVSVALKWKYYAGNSLRDASLTLDQAQGCILTDTDRRKGIATMEEPSVIGSQHFEPHYQSEGSWCWKEKSSTRLLNNSELANRFFEKLFHLIERVSKGELRFDYDAMLSRRRR